MARATWWLKAALQNTPHGRFLKLVGGALAVYFLWPMVNRNNAVQRQIRRFLNPRPPQAPAAAGRVTTSRVQLNNCQTCRNQGQVDHFGPSTSCL